jgi:hypothetical protein
MQSSGYTENSLGAIRHLCDLPEFFASFAVKSFLIAKIAREAA